MSETTRSRIAHHSFPTWNPLGVGTEFKYPIMWKIALPNNIYLAFKQKICADIAFKHNTNTFSESNEEINTSKDKRTKTSKLLLSRI